MKSDIAFATGPDWMSPIRVGHHYRKLIDSVGIERALNHQKASEAWTAAQAALVMYALNGRLATYVQLPKNDPPDAYVMWSSKDGATQHTTEVEITSYREGAKVSLLDQLLKTKLRDTPTTSSQVLIVVDVQGRPRPNLKEVCEALKRTNAQYQLWIFEKLPNSEGKLRVSMLNPKLEAFEFPLERIWQDYVDKGFKEMVHRKRAGSMATVRQEEGPDESDEPPWHHIAAET